MLTMSPRLAGALLLTLGLGCAAVPKPVPGGDGDGDRIPDATDECPDAAEEKAGDGDGCPDAPQIEIESGMIEIRGKIVFALGSAELAPQNAKLLELLATLLNENQSIQHIEVEGHTDTTGDEAFNKQLSLERAQTVVKALIQRGVQAERLSSKGMGTSQPRASNDTAAGRARNRRVEFRVLD
ncbi:MAG: cell envelope biosis protein OmpA [Myxococcaceae bacterium]|nr:cell envelope biosis protein OmpA [Myxococcaceae bacterium]